MPLWWATLTPMDEQPGLTGDEHGAASAWAAGGSGGAPSWPWC